MYVFIYRRKNGQWRCFDGGEESSSLKLARGIHGEGRSQGAKGEIFDCQIWITSNVANTQETGSGDVAI